MSDPSRTNNIEIKLYDPFTGTIKKSYKIKGGKGLDFLEQDVSTIETTETVQTKDVKIFPIDSYRDIRYKVFLLTGIQPFRQHLIPIIKDEYKVLNYCVIAGVDYEVNLIKDMSKKDTDTILNIPIEKVYFNNKNDISVPMLEISQGPILDGVTEILIVDLYDLVPLQSPEVVNIMKNEFHESMLYYCIILKYFPMLTYDMFNNLYLGGNVVCTIEDLCPNFDKLLIENEKETELLSELYSYEKELPKELSKYTVNIKNLSLVYDFMYINTRAFFDLFRVTEVYHFICTKEVIHNNVYVVEKKYQGSDVYIDHENVPMDGIVIVLEDSTEITIDGLRLNIYLQLEKPIDNTHVFNYAQSLYNFITKFIKTNSEAIIVSHIPKDDYGIVESVITDVRLPIVWDISDFNIFSDYLKNMRIITYKHRNNRTITFTINKGVTSDYEFLADNAYSYYTNTEIKRKTEISARRDIAITHNANSIEINLINKEEYSHRVTLRLVIYIIYKFNKNKKPTTETTSSFRKVKRLQDIDPNLFNIKQYDPSMPVYATRCQVERQPTIYNQKEYNKLSADKKKKVTKFKNFSQDSPVYYSCENKKYPYLSFNPLLHPLLYCIPCCKKIPSSDVSTKSRFNDICLKKFQLTNEEIEEILSETSINHILIYKKNIPVGRFSDIYPAIKRKIIGDEDTYMLAGVEQTHKHSLANIVNAIAYIFNLSVRDFVKNIVKNKNKLYNLIDITSCYFVENADDLADIFVDVFIENKNDIIYQYYELKTLLKWEILMCDIVYYLYGVYLLIILDNDTEVRLAIHQSTQASYLLKEDRPYCIISMHNNGTYPLVKKDKGGKINTIYSTEERIIKQLMDITTSIYQFDVTVDVTIMLVFLKKCKKYELVNLVSNSKKMIYACILKVGSKKIYIPIEYNVLYDDRDDIIQDLTDFSQFSRDPLYDFLKDFNKITNTSLTIVNNLSYNGSYIGVQITTGGSRRFPLTAYHKPYKTLDNDAPIVNVPYNIIDINKYMKVENMTTVINGAAEALYKNFVYRLFTLELANLVQKKKNIKIRTQIIEILQGIPVNFASLRELLKDNIEDYTYIKTSFNRGKEVAIKNVAFGVFGFDKGILNEIENMSDNDAQTILKSHMKPIVIIEKNIPPLYSTSRSCSLDIKQSHCKAKKLIITQELFDNCIETLVKDIKNPYRRDYISQLSLVPTYSFTFTKKPGEIINIYQI